jgi:transporter family-2 protein
MNYATAGFLGTLITLMVMFNSMLAVKSGHLLSLIVLHFVGICAATIIILCIRKTKQTNNAPFYWYSAGIIGVLIVYFNNLCFPVLGASVTLSLAIIGQSIGSIITDSTGIFGMAKHRFEKKKFIGFLIVLVGILIMVENWQFRIGYIVISFGTGFLVVLTMIFNSRLASYVGVFRTTRINYITGLICLIPIVFLSKIQISESIRILSRIHPVYICGGGVTGVFIVAGINYVVPRLSTIYTTILMFTGQMLTGLAIDFYMGHDFSIRLIVGALLLVSGLGFNLWAKRKGEKKPFTDNSHCPVLSETQAT